jgi:bifunctional non-homologous end joining protein LigD
MIPGSKPVDEKPGFIEPCLATLEAEIPKGKGWLHEIKFDGYRMQPHLDRGYVTVYSRNGLDWTKRVRFMVEEIAALPANKLVLDVELVSADENHGASDFAQLQADLSAGRHDRLVFYAFDILHLDGFDLRSAPLVERKRVLKSFLEEAQPKRIFYSEHFETGDDALYRYACEMGLEGVVVKRRDAPYRSGHGKTWIKVKCVKRAEFNIIGFVPARRDSISALRLARKDQVGWTYVGKVGTGFSNETAEDLRRRLNKLVTLNPPLRLRKPDTKWVEPKLTAKVAYSGMTGDGKLRHPSFKGLTKV